MKVTAISTALPAVAPSRHNVSNGDPPRDAIDLRQGLTKEYLQSALTTRIGKAVEEALQVHGLSLADSVGVDVSAEATSDRIVAGTTGMLGIYARQNPDVDRATLIDRFEATIRGGIARGYQEAIGILEAMAAFDEDIRGLGQETMRLVTQKLDAYFAKLRESAPAGAA